MRRRGRKCSSCGGSESELDLVNGVCGFCAAAHEVLHPDGSVEVVLKKAGVSITGSLLSRVTFSRSESGGYTSVHFDDVEVGLIGRGFSLTVVGPFEVNDPIQKMDGWKFRSLDAAKTAIMEAYGEVRS